jgi:hypothetical protein
MVSLATIILFMAFSPLVFGLDEIIDDYENLNRVQGSHNIVRNSTLDCIELNYSAVGNPVYEDFTNFTEVDSLTRLQQTANRSTFNIQRTDDNIYLYGDYGAGYFDDVTHEFNVYIDSCDSTASAQYRVILYSLTNMLGDWIAYWTNTESLDLIAKSNNVAGQFSLRLVSGYNGGTNWYFFNESSGLDDDTYYFMRLTISGRNCTLWIYSDNDRTSLVEKIICNQVYEQTYRYILAPASLDYASGSYFIQGYLEQLWIGDVLGGYHNEGWFYTTQFWPGASDDLIVLLYYMTLGNGDTIKAQISPDNSTWYDHNLGSSNETLVQGYEALDLRDLNFTSPYLRFYLLDGGTDSTPQLYQLRVVNNATATAATPTAAPFEMPQSVIGIWIWAGLIVMGFIYTRPGFLIGGAIIGITLSIMVLMIQGFILLGLAFLFTNIFLMLLMMFWIK